MKIRKMYMPDGSGGFIGFNPEEAQKNLNDTMQSIYAIAHSYAKSCFNFCDDLADKWASPNSAIFFKSNIPLMNQNTKEINMLASSLYRIVSEAYRELAVANGMEVPIMHTQAIIPDDCNYELMHLDDISEYLYKESYENVVGMNKVQAKRLLEKFKQDIQNMLAEFDNVPIALAFYDPNDEMIGAYQDEIKLIEKNITDNVNDIVSAIESALTTEINRVILAEKQSINAMNNG